MTEPTAARSGSVLSSRVYAALTAMIEPWAGPALAWLDRKEPPHLRAERLGRIVSHPIDTWWHAASLGEVAALRPVLDRAEARGVAGRVLVTTTSSAGRDMASRHWPGRACLAPLDLPRLVSRVLAARGPGAVILVETELWPTVIRKVLARGIPLAVVNARISDRAWNRTRRWTPVPRRDFAALRAVAARTERDAERFRSLGVLPEAIRVTGNTKHDRDLRSSPAHLPWREVRLWTAGSLRPGEEHAILGAYEMLRPQHRELRLALVPRHPGTWPELSREIQRRGWRLAVRSRPAAEDAEADVLLVDTQGDLPSFYAASTACFVGGTLVPVGGHNVMEAAAVGLPIVVGPHTGAIAQDVEELARVGALETASTAEAIAHTLGAWVRDPERAREAGRRGLEVAQASRGAAERTVNWLVERGVLPARGTT